MQMHGLYESIKNEAVSIVVVNKRKHKTYIKKRDVYTKSSAARKAAKKYGLKGIHSHGRGKNKRFMPGSSHGAYLRAVRRKKNG
tara:strand:- start:149 stop:400 length:252 start_codon:yes stop_codon:yes gene_type:complete